MPCAADAGVPRAGAIDDMAGEAHSDWPFRPTRYFPRRTAIRWSPAQSSAHEPWRGAVKSPHLVATRSSPGNSACNTGINPHNGGSQKERNCVWEDLIMPEAEQARPSYGRWFVL